jgi:hypothetical protein
MIKRVLVVTGMFWATVSIAIAEQPNILVVMSDDQGVGDIGLAGNQWARTPVLDRLAAESAQFANIVAAPARPTPPEACWAGGEIACCEDVSGFEHGSAGASPAGGRKTREFRRFRIEATRSFSL